MCRSRIKRGLRPFEVRGLRLEAMEFGIKNAECGKEKKVEDPPFSGGLKGIGPSAV
jgi:hypothetical protein